MVIRCLMRSNFRTYNPTNAFGRIKCSECGATCPIGNWHSKTCGTPKCMRARKTRLQAERRGEKEHR